MHKWISISQPSDYDQLCTELEEEFAPEQVVEQLRELSSEIKGVLLEYPYVDKDYRSTYYGFYAKKGLRYSAFCARLHFFGSDVELTPELELRWKGGELRNHYFGYMVLRPTTVTPIGRTVLSVQAKKSFAGAVISANHLVHLLGHRIEVRGFPYMQQHTDISVCAHAVCWGILRHYSERYRRYAEFLVQDITRMACENDPGGLAPSRGLVVDQACRVFASAGLYPDVYDKAQFNNNFYRILNAYVESGFPVFAAMHGRSHAIAIVGHGTPDRQGLVAGGGLQYVWDATNSYVVIDDNLLPYHEIDSLNSTPYKVTDVDIFIVPLPEKIFFPAEAVESHIQHILTNSQGIGLDLGHLVDPVIRYFITTSASFKKYVMENKSQFSNEFFVALSEIVLPQFIWMVEIASLTDWQQKRFNVLMVLDATASAHDALPFFVVNDLEKAFIYDRGVQREAGWVKFGVKQTNYFSEFRSNLTSMS